MVMLHELEPFWFVIDVQWAQIVVCFVEDCDIIEPVYK